MRFNPAEYDDVNSRIAKFWEQYPQGRIVTSLKSSADAIDEVVFQAFLYTDREDNQAVATGWASEKRGSGGANNTHHVENAETSAIGRALANFNFKTHKDAPRPSRQEMQKPEREGYQSRPSYATTNNYGPRQNFDATTGEVFEDPQDTPSGRPAPRSNYAQTSGEPPSERQLEYLKSTGYDGPIPANKGEASQLISRLKASR